MEYTTGGYTCTVCGIFVMHGVNHICGGSPSVYPPYIPAPSSNDEIITKLNEIIEILKTIQRRVS